MIWSSLALVEILEVQFVHGLDKRAALLGSADHHLHEWRQLGFGCLRPFADRGILLLQRLQVEAGEREEGDAFRAGRPFLACDLIEMAAGAGLLKRRDRHDPPVLLAIVTGRAGVRNALCCILLRHFGKVLLEMARMIVDDPRAPIERIVFELRVMAVEAVELHDMARAALLVGDLAQFEIGAFMLLVARRASEAA